MSPDTLYLWLQVVYAIGTLTLFPMAYLVWQIRRNDLRQAGRPPRGAVSD